MIGWLAAVSVGLAAGWLAEAVATGLIQALAGSAHEASPRGVILLGGYLTWVVVALAVSGLVLRRMRD